MRLETYDGASIPELLTIAQAEIGPDAVLLSVARSARTGARFSVTAADPEAAEAWSRALAPAPVERPEPAVDHADDDPGDAFQSVLDEYGTPASVRPADDGRRIIALVGPTGSGKTTTAAKLATMPGDPPGQSVGLMTLDTYRVGGVEQLRAYARLAGVPLALVHEPADVPRALHRLRNVDVVLVDTPGRGPREHADARAVELSLRLIGPDEIHYLLPAGLDRRASAAAAEGARRLGATHLLPTKVDELIASKAAVKECIWGSVALCRRLGMEIRWLTDGQRVPGNLRRFPTA